LLGQDAMHEHTIAGPIEFKGIGLHTGELAAMRILPAPPGKGINFRRVDLDNFEIRADVGSVARVAYATTLMNKGVWISTVEHVLSALYGVGVDNAYVELDNFEVPILDGSALPYTDAIARVGLTSQNRKRKYLRITKPFTLDENGKTIGIFPSDTLSIRYEINFPHPVIGEQKLEVEIGGANFANLIAPARTFGFFHEVEKLQASGLIRGGSLENAIVLTENGMLNDTSLRFPDEFVRHKILDLLGDFALIGQAVRGRLIANRAGHALHTRFVAELLESTSHWELTEDASVAVSAD
jgi:UDP-3-O-[3-hydroxymyristoyl] N-acetylglucosamine deacetylase